MDAHSPVCPLCPRVARAAFANIPANIVHRCPTPCGVVGTIDRWIFFLDTVCMASYIPTAQMGGGGGGGGGGEE